MDLEEKQRNYEHAEKLLSEQRFAIAAVAGIIMMLLGTICYAAAALAAGGPSVSILYVGIGAAIGLTIQYLGNGIDTKFAAAASILATIGFFLAKLMTIAIYTAKAERIPVMQLLDAERLGTMWGWVLSGFNLLDLIFCIAAIVAASLLSKRRLTYDEGQAIRTYERQ